MALHAMRVVHQDSANKSKAGQSEGNCCQLHKPRLDVCITRAIVLGVCPLFLDLYTCFVCYRQKIGDNPAQATVTQLSAQIGDDDDSSFKPSLHTNDAQYLRKRKLHMDSLFDNAVDT